LVLMFLWAMGLLLTHSFHSFSEGQIESPYTLATWRHFLSSAFYWSIVRETVQLGLIVTVLCLLLGYPTAYVLARIENRFVLVASYVILFAPLLVSVVVRSYGWLLLLGNNGLVNDAINALPGTHGPYRLVYNDFGVTVALVHIMLPFAVFPILSVLRQVPPGLDEAAADLGARPGQAFRRVVLPLSLPGLVSAAQIVFTLTISAWVTAVLLGGGRVLVLAKLVYDNISQLNWPMGAVEACVLLVVALIALALFARLGRSVQPGERS
jgi:putative spermidine/putrescine transport system permease protein